MRGEVHRKQGRHDGCIHDGGFVLECAFHHGRLDVPEPCMGGMQVLDWILTVRAFTSPPVSISLAVCDIGEQPDPECRAREVLEGELLHWSHCAFDHK